MAEQDERTASMLIRDMVADERPREKAERLGIKALSTVELMAIIFSTGVSGKSVIQLSNEILADAEGHLSKVARLSVGELLKRYKGIGRAKALSLLAALELGSRAGADARAVSDPKVTGPEDAYQLMRQYFERLDHEQFWVMMLNRANHVIGTYCVSQGGMAATVVDVKIIMRKALEKNAQVLILAHNHPSGNMMPSAQDDSLTRRIVEAAKLFEIPVLDHLIITDAGYYSYRDSGKL